MRTAIAMALLAASASAADLHLVPAGDPAFLVEGAAVSELVDDADGRRLRLRRPLDMPGKGYGWDNPGATVRFRTAARPVAVRLRYSERHVSTTARNGTGLVLVDGVWRPGWTFDPGTMAVRRPVTVIERELPAPADAGEHEYTLVMPYGDSVEFAGALVPAGCTVGAPAAAPRRLRWVAYGDSVTQGFDASHVGAGYPWQVARARGWEAVNLGLGGRTCEPGDAAAIAACRPDLATVAIGVNDWQTGRDPADYGRRLADLLARLRTAAPRARVTVIAPLWVADHWRPAAAAHPLEAYRAAALAAAAAAGVQAIDGSTLIDHDPARFDRAAVHPNDAGFAQMAGRLAGTLFPEQP